MAIAVEAILSRSALVRERAGHLLVAVTELADPVLATGAVRVTQGEALAVKAALTLGACP